jgi:hypothetical protein
MFAQITADAEVAPNVSDSAGKHAVARYFPRVDLAHRPPNARVRIYYDPGHGGIFQYHGQVVDEVLQFLEV